MLRTLLSLIFMCGFMSLNSKAQNIEIKIDQEPLNEVLYILGHTYDLQFSFSDNLLAGCIVSDSASYKTVDEALQSLLSNCDYTFKMTNDVFVIYQERSRQKNTNQKTLYLLKEQNTDQQSPEPVPYTHIQISQIGVHSDWNGYDIFDPHMIWNRG